MFNAFAPKELEYFLFEEVSQKVKEYKWTSKTGTPMFLRS